MDPLPLFCFWALAAALQLIFGVIAVMRNRRLTREPIHRSLPISALASVIPLLALIMFTRVFVIGRSSSVRQLAGAAGATLWSDWAFVWPLFYLGAPAAVFVCVVVVMLPPYPPKLWQSTVSRGCAAVNAAFAYLVTMVNFPDA